MESPIEFNNYNMVDEAPMSRTHQYRKVMKPLLERRRRARINKCLDDLKDLMVSDFNLRVNPSPSWRKPTFWN